MPMARLIAIVVECRDPTLLGRFYAELLDGSVGYESPTWVQVNDADGWPVLAFHRVDRHRSFG